jgi:hypothetical protein
MIVFLHIPKTGGTTFRSILERNYGISHCHTNQTKRSVFTRHDFALACRFFPRLKSVAGHNLVDPSRLCVPDAYFMTILREPVLRVISHYQDSVLRGGNRETFEASLHGTDHLQNLQVKLIAGGANLDKAKVFLSRHCQFVGLTEKFDLSLHVFSRLFPGRLNLGYQRRVVARNDDVKMAVLADSRLVDMARGLNRLDVELYSFALNEVFPACCERAGIRPTDSTPNYETQSNVGSMRQTIGRFYNKAFREFYKVHSTMWPNHDETNA